MNDPTGRPPWFRRRGRPSAAGVASINLEDAYRRSPAMVALNLLVALLFSASVRGEADPATVTAFLAASVLSTLLRVALILGYRTHRQRLHELTWMYAFFASMWVAAGVWSVGGLAVIAGGTDLGRIVVMFYLTALALGGSAGYHALSLGVGSGVRSSFRNASHGTVAITMLPVCLTTLVEASGPAFMLAVGMLLALLQTFRSANLVQGAFDQAVAGAVTDAGTGLLNRRGFFEAATHARSRERLRQDDAQWFVLMIDIDHFKQINDRQGHAFGDTVIRSMGTTLLDLAPASSVCGRLGGEEFAVLTVAEGPRAAGTLAEDIRRTFASRAQALRSTDFLATCSVGVSAAAGTSDAIDQLLNEADRMLYRAKHQGRNRVVMASDLADTARSHGVPIVGAGP